MPSSEIRRKSIWTFLITDGNWLNVLVFGGTAMALLALCLAIVHYGFAPVATNVGIGLAVVAAGAILAVVFHCAVAGLAIGAITGALIATVYCGTCWFFPATLGEMSWQLYRANVSLLSFDVGVAGFVFGAFFWFKWLIEILFD